MGEIFLCGVQSYNKGRRDTERVCGGEVVLAPEELGVAVEECLN